MLIDPYDGNDANVGNDVMVGFRAGSPEKVRAAFEGVIALGGKDEGFPGLRKSLPGFYAASRHQIPRSTFSIYRTAENAQPFVCRLVHCDSSRRGHRVIH